jgi:hypothetical protein
LTPRRKGRLVLFEATGDVKELLDDTGVLDRVEEAGGEAGGEVGEEVGEEAGKEVGEEIGEEADEDLTEDTVVGRASDEELTLLWSWRGKLGSADPFAVGAGA